jgi:hypothetical protein
MSDSYADINAVPMRGGVETDLEITIDMKDGNDWEFHSAGMSSRKQTL